MQNHTAAEKSSNNSSEKSLGAYVSLEQLASFRLPAKQLSLVKNRKALNHLAGPYKALSRGRGMEFDSVRQYQAGDDIRSIDWRVTARVGKAHTKQFQEEKEIPSLVIVDQRQNMFFGSQLAMKSVIACDVAAYLSWAVLHKGDQLGGLIFNDNEEFDLRPRRQRKTVLSFLQALSRFNQQLNQKPVSQTRPLSLALSEARRILKPGQQLYIISDFFDFDDDCLASFHQLRKHSDVIAIQISDPLEQQLPASGRYTVSNGKQRLQLNSDSKAAREKYREQFSQHQSYIQQSLGQLHIPVIPISTCDNALSVLQQFLGKSLGARRG
jgi:uncharacterized protein (DUF58 family)